MHMLWTAPAWLLAVAAAALAQPVRLSGPAAGYIFDEGTRSLRPVIGFAGAALLGRPVGPPVELASSAPGGAWVFLARGEACCFIRMMPGGEAVEHCDPALIASLGRIVWSRDARWAVLESAEQGLIQRVALSESGIDALPPLESRLTVLAVSPDGRQIAAAAPGELVLVSETGASARLAELASPSVALFSRDGRTLYVADEASGRVISFRDGSRWLEFPSGGPAGLALSSDDELLFVLDGAGELVRLFETRSANAAGEIALDAPAASLELVREDLFLLRGAAGTSRYSLLDARRRALFFLPELDAAEQ